MVSVGVGTTPGSITASQRICRFVFLVDAAMAYQEPVSLSSLQLCLSSAELMRRQMKPSYKGDRSR